MTVNAPESPHLRRDLGQHHLTRAASCRPLIDFLSPLGGRQVLEIGPGGGVLTGALMAAKACVWALELDPAWAFRLQEQHRGACLRVAVADATEFRWQRLPAATLVAGNLPYNVATPLMRAWAASALRSPRAAFLIQLEVAERLTAAPGEPARGALSVLIQARAKVRRLARVPPGAFNPPPKVDSAFVGLERRPDSIALDDWPSFERFVFALFAHRRKTIRNNLVARFGKPAASALLALPVPPTGAPLDSRRRAETLSLVEIEGLWQNKRSTFPSLAR